MTIRSKQGFDVTSSLEGISRRLERYVTSGLSVRRDPSPTPLHCCASALLRSFLRYWARSVTFSLSSVTSIFGASLLIGKSVASSDSRGTESR